MSSVSLESVATIVMGQSPPGDKCSRFPGVCPLLNGPTEFGLQHPVPAQWTTAPARLAEPGDVLLCVRGSTTGRMNRADQVYAIGRGIAALRGADRVDTAYIHFALQATMSALLSRTSGSVFPNLSSGDIRAHAIPWPSRLKREAVVETLGALADKIGANVRLVTAVVDLAISLYEDAVSTGAELVALRDVGRWLSGGTPNTTESAYWGGNIPWISAASLKSFFVACSDRTLTPEGASSGTRLVPPGAILFVVRGMSLKTEFRVGVAQREVAFGQDCKAILVNGRYPAATAAVGLVAAQDRVLTLVDEAGHGTGRLPTDRIERLQIALPLPEKASATEEALSALLARGAAAEDESRRLVSLRDELLPLLISGELRVRDAEPLVGEAM